MMKASVKKAVSSTLFQVILTIHAMKLVLPTSTVVHAYVGVPDRIFVRKASILIFCRLYENQPACY